MIFLGLKFWLKVIFLGLKDAWDHFICPVASFSEIREKKKMKKRVEHRKTYKPGDYFICSVASFSEMREIG